MESQKAHLKYPTVGAILQASRIEQWKITRKIRLLIAPLTAGPVHPANRDCALEVIRQPCACVTRSWSIGHQLLRELASSGAYAVEPALYGIYARVAALPFVRPALPEWVLESTARK
jgi:hypothetical protein